MLGNFESLEKVATDEPLQLALVEVLSGYSCLVTLLCPEDTNIKQAMPRSVF